MVSLDRWYLAEGLATAAAVGMTLVVVWYGLVHDPTALTMLPDATGSALLLLVTMAVSAIGGAVGVWLENLPLATLGAILLLLFGASQSIVIGPAIILFAMMLTIATYLQWRRGRLQAP